MNNVLVLVQAARTSSNPGPILYSEHMLIELLALHEEMIGQLRLERMEAAGNAAFLSGMIDQHEQTAAMIRAKLDGRPSGGPVAVGAADPFHLPAETEQTAQIAAGIRRIKRDLGTSANPNHQRPPTQISPT